jgi:hypothetical protein
LLRRRLRIGLGRRFINSQLFPTPSPGPPRLVKAPAARQPSPRGAGLYPYLPLDRGSNRGGSTPRRSGTDCRHGETGNASRVQPSPGGEGGRRRMPGEGLFSRFAPSDLSTEPSGPLPSKQRISPYVSSGVSWLANAQGGDAHDCRRTAQQPLRGLGSAVIPLTRPRTSGTQPALSPAGAGRVRGSGTRCRI